MGGNAGAGCLHDTGNAAGAGHLHSTAKAAGAGYLHSTRNAAGAGDLHNTRNAAGTGHLHSTGNAAGTGRLHSTRNAGAGHVHNTGNAGTGYLYNASVCRWWPNWFRRPTNSTRSNRWASAGEYYGRGRSWLWWAANSRSNRCASAYHSRTGIHLHEYDSGNSTRSNWWKLPGSNCWWASFYAGYTANSGYQMAGQAGYVYGGAGYTQCSTTVQTGAGASYTPRGQNMQVQGQTLSSCTPPVNYTY